MSKQREEFEAWLKESNKHVYDVYMDEYSSSDNTENMCAEWAWKAWQQAQKATVPDGWVVVPREPTEDMLSSADTYTWHDEIYKAMIEAVDQPV